MADALRGLLDGHVLLSRDLAERGHYPAIDVSASVSRTMGQVVSPAHRAAAQRARVLWSALRRAEELSEIGALRPGADALLDAAVAAGPALRGYLIQDLGAPLGFQQSVAALPTKGDQALERLTAAFTSEASASAG